MAAKKVRAQTVTGEGIRPYGELIENAGREPAFDSEVFSFWNDISVGDVGGPVSFGMVNTKPGEMVAPMLERHLRTTESLVALDADIVLVLGEPTDGESPNLEKVAAFRVPKGSGVTLKKGTWHYIPLVPDKVPARTLVVFRQGTPAEDLEIYQLQEKDGVSIVVG